jgi:hypothetical protein
MLRYGIGALVLGGLGFAYFGGGQPAPEKAGEPSPGGLDRIKNNLNDFMDVSSEPR